MPGARDGDETFDPGAGDARGAPGGGGTPDEDQVETSAETWTVDETVGEEAFPQVPDYRIVRVLGEGGMGRVYEAVHEPLGRTVALKVLRGGHRSPDMIDRFMKEMRVLAHVEHPGVARVFDAGSYTVDGDVLPFFVMEYVAGARQLNDFLRPVELPLPAKLDLFAQVCDAVAHLHDRGVVHRDLKPDNILIGRDGEPKLIDFGVAKVLGPVLPGTDSVETQPGLAPGTPMYMSPEQTEGESSLVTAQSDIYSLGVTFYKLLTGSLPYKIDDRAGLPAYQVIRSVPLVSATERDPSLPRSIDLVLGRALRRDPDDRYTSAAEFAVDLRRVAEGETPEWAQKGEFTRLVARTRRRMRRRPLVACGIAAAASALFMMVIGLPALTRWQAPGRAAWAALSPLVASAANGNAATHAGGPMAGVRVAAMSDDTLARIDELAAAAGAEAFNPQAPSGFRWLHAAVLDRLAETTARAVVFDYHVGRGVESEWDGRLFDAVRRLCDAGIPLVVGVMRWDAPGGVPDTNAGLVQACDGVHVGGMSIQDPPDRAWSVDLAVRRKNDLARPGLALAGYALSRERDASFDIEIRGETGDVVVRHWIDSVVRSGVGEETTLNASTTRLDAHDPSFGLGPGDVVAKAIVPIPGEAMLSASTVDYAEVLTLDLSELNERVKNSVVVLGSSVMTKSPAHTPQIEDWSWHFDGRRVPRVYAHAALVQQLMNAVRVRPPDDEQMLLLVLGSAVMGAVSALAVVRSRRHSAAGLLVCVVSVCFLSVGLAWLSGVILDPTPLVLSSLVAWGVGMALLRRPRAGAVA